MLTEWIAPSKDHPLEGYAIMREGDLSVIATITALEWDRRPIERIERALRAHLWRAKVIAAALEPPSFQRNPDETDAEYLTRWKAAKLC